MVLDDRFHGYPPREAPKAGSRIVVRLLALPEQSIPWQIPLANLDFKRHLGPGRVTTFVEATGMDDPKVADISAQLVKSRAAQPPFPSGRGPQDHAIGDGEARNVNDFHARTR